MQSDPILRAALACMLTQDLRHRDAALLQLEALFDTEQWPDWRDKAHLGDPADIRTDTYRASGAGGQHVNKTDSAVRMTHTPTGIVVQCQSQRSQHQNRDKALQLLKSKLYEKEVEERRKQQEAVEGAKSDIGWGSQIRSYVLHPYRMVKDHRTNFEHHSPDDVLDGELDPFVREWLAKSATS